MKRTRRRKNNRNLIFIRLIFIVLILVVAINLVRGTLARYRSRALSEADVDLAYYLVNSGSVSQTLKIDSMIPKNTANEYNFFVANYRDGERTQTALDYTIQIRTTTNLHLTYSVHKQGETTNLITSNVDRPDSDGTIFKYLTVSGGTFGVTTNQQDVYVLEVTFSEDYKSAEYAGIIEYVEITIDSSQKLGT